VSGRDRDDEAPDAFKRAKDGPIGKTAYMRLGLWVCATLITGADATGRQQMGADNEA
jgi:hypothetical protein